MRTMGAGSLGSAAPAGQARRLESPRCQIACCCHRWYLARRNTRARVMSASCRHLGSEDTLQRDPKPQGPGAAPTAHALAALAAAATVSSGSHQWRKCRDCRTAPPLREHESLATARQSTWRALLHRNPRLAGRPRSPGACPGRSSYPRAAWAGLQRRALRAGHRAPVVYRFGCHGPAASSNSRVPPGEERAQTA